MSLHCFIKWHILNVFFGPGFWSEEHSYSRRSWECYRQDVMQELENDKDKDVDEEEREYNDSD